ncbi:MULTISPECIES: ribbon-helix-helix protein, CopG family [Pseudomonas]|jgi:RHH-type proline utilization regulon transcriptional repressor/proline dehydrogenase/delta 1-pyrroline-5-carboxylate dehydrogenase|uniref:Ribbon-helix-helix protein, CopG family n=1 Tax=Pseudomonas bijieensis TaxID=2681983 RepID=A0A6N1CLR6_9PSED|nr:MULTISPECIES: ribbon-helix-helix protein, CopG family [Pseudomonas]AXP04074.1 ribbon-helix-helix protein, CopG family [Pseudomonas fluorescens]PWJ31676.1 RHH-type proline utilization regulon transcriptional repressor/proline dehydrogenase/delta 1-pyrroline-5-carboxylate dehydrogenase [Pseudomonas sp. 43mfcvi1.1]QIB07847.1 ribbon-helix-helix protein, CopG family [Pseudomonas fluorescens]QKS85685.1 ribbon-helix-helix protein, CopG family [Pseudomonas bijieensis]WLH60989.1 ribbon-helix-helix p
MAVTTQGIKLDEDTQARLKSAAARLDRTSHWFMKKAILNFIEKIEAGAGIEELVATELLEKDARRHSIARRLCKDCSIDDLN